jgi:polar amino acid transport system substrate-binding protein
MPPMRKYPRLMVVGLLWSVANIGVARAADPPLRAGILDDAAPYVVHQPDGKLSGFTVELFRLIAARMQRDIEFTTASQPALYDGLAHRKYDVLPGPIPATPELAGSMLLLEGYVSSSFQFATRANLHMQALSDLHGRRLAVRRETPYAEWADRNAQRYGFTVLPVASSAAAAEAVLDGTADVSLSGSPVQEYMAVRRRDFSPALSLPETTVHESAAVGVNEIELRDEMEDALRCLKMDGTVARLSKEWFGRNPDAEDLENLVVPGYGVPGLAGYDPKFRKTRC